MAILELSPGWLEPGIDGELLLIGLDDLTRQVQEVDLRRVHHAELLPEPSEPIDNAYWLMERFQHSRAGHRAGKVTVRLAFVPGVARDAARQLWPGMQTIQYEPDGQCVITMRVHDWHSLMRRILSWGADVKVLEPIGLQQDLITLADQILQQYEPASALA